MNFVLNGNIIMSWPTYFLISITVLVSFLTNDFFFKISNFQLKEKKKTPALYYEAPSVLFPNSTNILMKPYAPSQSSCLSQNSNFKNC